MRLILIYVGEPLRISAFITAFVVTAVLSTGIARADDQPFLTLDATDIEPEFGHELEQNFAWNHGLSHAGFDEFESETEWEYGLTDQIQLAVSTALSWSRTREHLSPPVPYQGAGAWGGIEGEAIWQAMNVYFDPIGLGFKFNAAAGPSERAFAATILLQKNFFNDRLRLVTNIGGEFGRAKDGAWSDYSTLTVNAGAAYNITWAWSAGLEFDTERDFDGIAFGGHGPTSFFAGPTVQYVAHPWTATLGVQAQLPWAGGGAGGVANGYVADLERWRVGLRVTRDFY